MILTDREIKIAIERGSITIDPPPEPHAYSSTSVDPTLDPVLNEFKEEQGGIEQIIDPTHAGFNHELVMKSLTNKREIDTKDGYPLHPQKFVLA